MGAARLAEDFASAERIGASEAWNISDSAIGPWRLSKTLAVAFALA